MEDDQLAVVAHGLLNSLGVIVGSIATAEALLRRREGIDADVARMLATAKHHSRFVGESLRDIVLAVPFEIRAALDTLDATRDVPEVQQRFPFSSTPIGWRTAVAVLRSGLGRRVAIETVQEEFALGLDEAVATVTFAAAWLEESDIA